VGQGVGEALSPAGIAAGVEHDCDVGWHAAPQHGTALGGRQLFNH
jgi:hypothetical protein